MKNKAWSKSEEAAAAAGTGFYTGLGLLILLLASTFTLPLLFSGTAFTEASFIGLVCLVTILAVGIPLFWKYGGQCFDHIIHKGIEVFSGDNELAETLKEDCDMCRSDKAVAKAEGGKREFIWGSLMGFGIGGFIGLLVCAASSADSVSVPWFVWLGTALFVVALLWLACHLVIDLYGKQMEQIPGIGSILSSMMEQMYLRFDQGVNYGLVLSIEEDDDDRSLSEVSSADEESETDDLPTYNEHSETLDSGRPYYVGYVQPPVDSGQGNFPSVPTIVPMPSVAGQRVVMPISDGAYFSYVSLTDDLPVGDSGRQFSGGVPFNSSDAVLVFNS